MRMQVLGGPDLVSGFRLAGVRGQVVTNDEEAVAAFTQIVRDAEVAILVVSGSVAAAAKTEIAAVRVRHGFPIVVEVAQPGEPARDPESLMRFVGEAVGLRL